MYPPPRRDFLTPRTWQLRTSNFTHHMLMLTHTIEHHMPVHHKFTSHCRGKSGSNQTAA